MSSRAAVLTLSNSVIELARFSSRHRSYSRNAISVERQSHKKDEVTSPMITVRILIYTDYDKINESEDPHGWGITELKKLVKFKTNGVADVRFTRVYRFASKTQPQRLTRDFLSGYDQLWVFGFLGAREAPYELDSEEVEALKDWMDRGGGLLFAGDHAGGVCGKGDPLQFNTHGRSLGEPMKRAGQLRVWQGPPTACTDKPLPDRDNYNTCEGDDPLCSALSQFYS